MKGLLSVRHDRDQLVCCERGVLSKYITDKSPFFINPLIAKCVNIYGKFLLSVLGL